MATALADRDVPVPYVVTATTRLDLDTIKQVDKIVRSSRSSRSKVLAHLIAVGLETEGK